MTTNWYLCRTCYGVGELSGETCPNCQGTGKQIERPEISEAASDRAMEASVEAVEKCPHNENPAYPCDACHEMAHPSCTHDEHDHGICEDCGADLHNELAMKAEAAFEGDR